MALASFLFVLFKGGMWSWVFLRVGYAKLSVLGGFIKYQIGVVTFGKYYSNIYLL